MKIKITTQPYDYECGDGCCSYFGSTWKVNGKEVYKGPDEDEAILAILEHLKIEAEICILDQLTGEEVTSLANYVEQSEE